MSKHSSLLGFFVVVSDAEDATVYKVVDKHPNAPSYLLAYQTPRGLVTGGWMDIRCLKAATPSQIQAAGIQ